MNLHAEMLIGGHFVGGPCDRSTGKLVIRAPFDGAIVGTAAEGGWSEANAAIEFAWEARQPLSQMERADRSDRLRQVATVVRERSDELAELLTLEVGKPVTWSRGEVSRLALTFELASDAATGYGEEVVDVQYDPRGVDYRASVRRFPVGVVLGIVPYNWPLNLAAHKIAPALAVGCPIIVKASSLAPLSTLNLARIVHEVGWPDGAINAIACPSPIAERMALDPRVAKVSFTGSPKVGWALKEKLPRKRVTLELGGDASALVFPDADLDWAVQRITHGKFGYAGQICISVQHARVHKDVYEQVRERLIEATLSCPFGDPTDPGVVCGPVIDDGAADRIMSWIEEAKSMGARVLAGGTREGRMIAPTLIEGVPPDSKLGCEEVFGPVLCLSEFADLEETIRQVNASRYGIHCGIFSKDEAVALAAFEELQVGGVVVNDIPTVRFDGLPYGGVKLSGFGREGVKYAMDEMTEPRSLVVRKP